MKQIRWQYDEKPRCKNGDTVILVQYGRADVGRYISPKPKSAPPDGGDFIFEMCDNDDDQWDDLVLAAVLAQYPDAKMSENPILFTCPDDLARKAAFSNILDENPRTNRVSRRRAAVLLRCECPWPGVAALIVRLHK